ncbi:hypothetical protein DLE60_22440 [Micromonospora globispora]|uniref:Uncharacterized protein n=1 Tax=Micromonospora globispora TaxID=1450148 RepID=A0A317K090_9ACTN|nr:hypothetical protein [Micromonospora globispora]PWU46341.1 hypothetical protein DLJ46_18455 [Micromonospora globispora]PWU58318.1 hypothetical protein DLE60_22440 [Micromonospora globispora]RQW87750.1 hypothetical protein DKL51_25650 [Micromonospora globispora]
MAAGAASGGEDLFEHEEVAALADDVAVRWEGDSFHAGARHTDRCVCWLTGWYRQEPPAR